MVVVVEVDAPVNAGGDGDLYMIIDNQQCWFRSNVYIYAVMMSIGQSRCTSLFTPKV